MTPGRIYAGYSDEALARSIIEYGEYVREHREALDDLRTALRLLREEAALRKKLARAARR